MLSADDEACRTREWSVQAGQVGRAVNVGCDTSWVQRAEYETKRANEDKLYSARLKKRVNGLQRHTVLFLGCGMTWAVVESPNG